MKKTVLVSTGLLWMIAVACFSVSCKKEPSSDKSIMLIKVMGDAEGTDMVVDKKGNMYVVGYFNGTATFGDTEKK